MASVLSQAHFHSEEAAYAFVEGRLWTNGRPCPHCGVVDKSGPLTGKSTRIGVYKCYACRKPFTVKVGTVFQASHIKLHIWLQAMHLLSSSKKGISANQLHRILGVSLQTAWFLAHRIREAMADLKMDPMGGEGETIEADDTYVGGKERNKHRAKRKAENAIGGGMGKVIVYSLVERGGRVRSQRIESVKAADLRSILREHVRPQSTLMTDAAGQNRILNTGFARHDMVNHSIDEYVRGDAHTNTVEGFFSILKRGITGCYFHVSQEHLHRYLAEFDFRYTHRSANGVEDAERTDKIVAGVVGKRLTYKTARRGRRAQALDE